MMSSSREGSPDWLRCFQAPQQSLVTLSSDSEPSLDGSRVREDDVDHKEQSIHKTPQLSEGDQNQDTILIDSGGESPMTKTPKVKSPKSQVKQKYPKSQEKVENKKPTKKKKVENQNQIEGNEGKGEAMEEEVLERKHVEPHVSTSRLPLLCSDKVQRSKALVECEGESIDMSGDVGAVGRVIISETQSKNHEMLLDLKGTIYKTTILPCRTFCVVSFGQAEAKIEAVMNDFIQLKPQSNVYEAETMIEGTLDGFSFDSEEETDKIPTAVACQTDQNDEAEEQQTTGKTKGKVDKTLGVRKKGKAAGKPPKKGKRKAQAPKKAKSAKK
ncbi:PREDICTED: DNA-binding protein BIN4 [Nelumbo nucifera]|uniref:DNA-binding protein BIN4 n=1 Tax=Nelumbo nucifera TaxID=4432 RepID=A0A1U7Z1F9_NELNU|nr:PREDICTED: DNA-binding protein BIN4 [Nelumbo nucifera]